MLTKYVDTMSNFKRDPFGWTTVRNGGWDVFDEMFRDFGKTRVSSESYRCEQLQDEMIASFDLPGVKPGDVALSAEGRQLTIEYTLRDKKQKLHYDVSDEYDLSAAKAKLEHGVLEVRLPKLTRLKQKKIEIEVK